MQQNGIQNTGQWIWVVISISIQRNVLNQLAVITKRDAAQILFQGRFQMNISNQDIILYDSYIKRKNDDVIENLKRLFDNV